MCTKSRRHRAPALLNRARSTWRREGALLEAFPSNPALAQLVDFELGENLANISSGGTLRDVVYGLIMWAQANGALDRLVNAARTANPGNPRLRRFEESIVRDRNQRPEDAGLRHFADQVKLAPGPAAPPEEIVQIVDASTRYRSVDDWRRGQSRGELAVCRVELGQQGMSTGFLIGPDLVMTAFYAVDGVLKGVLRPTAVGLRFDYRAYGDGQTLSAGQVYRLAADPVVITSPVESFDFAVLRVDGRPGDDPVAGQAGAPGRGWLTPRAHTFHAGEMLFIIQHPAGGPLKLAYGPYVDAGPGGPYPKFDARPAETRIIYRVATEPGSGGAPVFSSDWELVALHEGAAWVEDRDLKRGVPMTSIVKVLADRGISETQTSSG